MSTNILRYSIIGAAIISSHAHAIGFGDITLHSAIGESLRAEVPLIGISNEAADTACFKLGPVGGADLPVVTAARVRVIRGNGGYRLQIIGQRPIAEPIFMIGLRASCGVDLQRDYVLMPEPPLATGESGTAPAPSAATLTEAGDKPLPRAWRASAGDTLESIAESLAGDDAAQQRRTLAALRRANPQLGADEPLAEGTSVRLAEPKRRSSAEARDRPPVRETRTQAWHPPARARNPSPPAQHDMAAPANDAPTAAPPARDRLVLGAAPNDLRPDQKPGQPSMSEMEARMLKLETTLQSLNGEVDKLNSALALATEALAAQNKLQVAQAAQAAQAQPAGVAANAPTPSRPPDTAQNNWLELLFSALLGGGIAAGLAGVLSRRRERRGDSELPLAVSGYRPEVQVASVKSDLQSEPPPADSQPPFAAGRVDIPLDGHSALHANTAPAGGALPADDHESALELAEIMLSFGRIRGAADTLAQHIEETSPANIQPWTMLLDLYRRGDMRQEFEDLMLRVRQRFNVQLAGWNETISPVSGLKSLEDYAHIVERLSSHWGSQAGLDYLYGLVHDNRSGQRNGFPLEVVEEIVLLMRVLENGYGLQHQG